ncbi:hypothetical protein MTO96_029983 [Rhipicephalus appendiculatus]
MSDSASADSTETEVELREGGKNPCFMCMGVCFLLIVLLVVLVAVIVHYVRPNLHANGTTADGPTCKAALELTACDSETEQYFFHQRPEETRVPGAMAAGPWLPRGKEPLRERHRVPEALRPKHFTARNRTG